MLCIGAFVNQTQTRKTCQNILQLEQVLWMFVDHEGIEPTNNVAERALRRAVIWRKRSFGT
ncbi:MAG: transposase [Anaerolineales bacterium]|nr:transposase [Anaerolineales bacterium]